MKRNISIVMALLLLLFGSNVIAQTKTFTISGKVTSFEESLALEGVSILVKGTKNLTGTQADGTFSIDVSPGNKVLIFELKDYETQEVSIKGKEQYDVILKRKANSAQIISDHHYYGESLKKVVADASQDTNNDKITNP
jgi:TonB-dependent starch-binding outer membrane protein SusC